MNKAYLLSALALAAKSRLVDREGDKYSFFGYFPCIAYKQKPGSSNYDWQSDYAADFEYKEGSMRYRYAYDIILDSETEHYYCDLNFYYPFEINWEVKEGETELNYIVAYNKFLVD